MPDASGTKLAKLLDLMGRCGKESGIADADAVPSQWPYSALGASSTLESVELSASSRREKYHVTEQLLSHLSRHEGLQRLHMSGTLSRAVIDRFFATTDGVAKEGYSSDTAAGGIHRAFRQLRKIDISIAPNAVASLMRFFAHHPPAPVTHITLRIEGCWTGHALIQDVAAHPSMQQQIRSLHISFSVINHPSLSAGDLHYLVGLTRLTDLSLVERPEGDYESRVSADITLGRFMAILERLGMRLLNLSLCVASQWLSDHATLDMFGRLCPLLESLTLAGDYSLDALGDACSSSSNSSAGVYPGHRGAPGQGSKSPKLFTRLKSLTISGRVRSPFLDHVRRLPHDGGQKNHPALWYVQLALPLTENFVFPLRVSMIVYQERREEIFFKTHFLTCLLFRDVSAEVYRLWFILRQHAPVIDSLQLSSFRENAVGYILFERAMPKIVAFSWQLGVAAELVCGGDPPS
jgi:hypothetical protein